MEQNFAKKTPEIHLWFWTSEGKPCTSEVKANTKAWIQSNELGIFPGSQGIINPDAAHSKWLGFDAALPGT